MSIEQEVIDLVARKTGKSKAKITPEKTFYELGIEFNGPAEVGDGFDRVFQVGIGRAAVAVDCGNFRIELAAPSQATR